MEIKVSEYTAADVAKMAEIWNEVVEDGVAFPQTEHLTEEAAAKFFAEQTYCGVAKKDGEIVGLYILHPNNIGRCGHISNASFAVSRNARGLHAGETLVRDCIKTAKEKGFRLLQFNAVVETNVAARRLYKKIGFTELGTIPGGFLDKNGKYENICLYYIEL